MILQNVALFSQRATWIRHKHTYVMFLLNLLSPSWFHPSAVAKSLQSCPTQCNPIDGSPPGSPVPGILQARTLEWVAIAFSSTWKWTVEVKSLSPVRLSDPMDCSLPGSPIPGILQAGTLEWVAIAFSSAWKWTVKVKSLSRVRLLGTPWSLLGVHKHSTFIYIWS